MVNDQRAITAVKTKKMQWNTETMTRIRTEKSTSLSDRENPRHQSSVVPLL